MTTRRTPSRRHRRPRGSALVVALLVALASTTALVTPAEAAVSTRVLLRATPASPIPGETLTLSGTTSPPVVRPVSFQRAEHGRWVTRATGRTNARGAYRMITRALAGPRVGYRAYLPRTRVGGRSYAAAVSPAAVVRTVPQSGTVTVPTTSRAVGERFTATAAFTPARTGRLSWLEARTGSTWTRVSALVRQSSAGRVSLSAYGRTAGATTYRAVTGALSGAPAAGTPTQTLAVTPARTTLLRDDGSSRRRSATPRFTTTTTDRPLVDSDTNGRADIYLLDHRSDTAVLVSRTPGGNGGNSASGGGSVSADGAWVVFPSTATDLAGDDSNRIEDVFLFERATGQVTRLTSFAEPPSEGTNWYDNSDTNPTISDDGTLIAYETDDSATTGSRSRQIVVVDRSSGAARPGSDVPGTYECTGARFSADGTHLAFTCYDDGPHLYVRDLVAGTDQQVSTELTGYFGYQERYYELSADGRYVVYMYDIDNQEKYSVAWRDLESGAVHRFPTTDTGDVGWTGYPHLSTDGTKVGVETTMALDPRDHNGIEDAYVWSLTDDSTELLSLNAAGTAAGNDRSTSPVLTDDGFALFRSKASDLVLDDSNGHEWDVFERDLR